MRRETGDRARGTGEGTEGSFTKRKEGEAMTQGSRN